MTVVGGKGQVKGSGVFVVGGGGGVGVLIQGK